MENILWCADKRLYEPEYINIFIYRRGIVQLVERWSPKPNVVGSNPTPSANARYRANINYVF